MAEVQFDTMKRMVAELYPGAGWKARVYNHMSKEQIIAIYYDSLHRGRFDKNAKKEKKKIEKENRKWYQLTIFDFMEEKK